MTQAGERIRVLTVDDHPLLRDGVATLIGLQPDMEVVGEAGDGEEAVQAHRELRPDIVLMDLQMPRMGGVDALRAIRRERPDVRVVVLTTYAGDAQVGRALKAGALGYLLKSTLHRELLHAIRAAYAGRRWIDADTALDVALHAADDALTDRELDVLRLVSDGCANKVIARRLNVSEDTVKTHLKNIFLKLDVTDRTHAAVLALKRGLIPT